MTVWGIVFVVLFAIAAVSAFSIMYWGAKLGFAEWKAEREKYGKKFRLTTDPFKHWPSIPWRIRRNYICSWIVAFLAFGAIIGLVKVNEIVCWFPMMTDDQVVCPS